MKRQMKWGALLVCALFAFTAHTAFAAQGMSATGYEKTYGINIPFTPSQRTSRSLSCRSRASSASTSSR